MNTVAYALHGMGVWRAYVTTQHSVSKTVLVYMAIDDFGDLVHNDIGQIAKSFSGSIGPQFYDPWPIPEGMMEAMVDGKLERRQIDHIMLTDRYRGPVPYLHGGEELIHVVAGPPIIIIRGARRGN